MLVDESNNIGEILSLTAQINEKLGIVTSGQTDTTL